MDTAELASELRVAVRRMLHRLRVEDAADELTVSQRSALGRIGDDRPMTLSALAAAEGVRPQSMSATVHTLEQDGLLRRTADPQDGRQQLISLTKAGRAKLDRSRADRNAWLARTIEETCSASEQRTLAAALPLLRRIIDA